MENVGLGSFKLKGHSRDILTLAYSPDGAFLATGSLDKTIRIWDAAMGHQVGEALEGHNSMVSAITYSPDGKHLVSGSCMGNTLRVWDTATRQNVMRLEPSNQTSSGIRAVQYSLDGTFIASGGDDCLLRLWSTHAGNCIVTIEHPKSVNSVAFSPSRPHIATACHDGLGRIYDVEQHRLVCELVGHRASVQSIQYSPDGSLLASSSNDYTIRLWDSQTGEVLRILRGHRHYVTGISFSYDGQQLVSSSYDESIRVWDVASGEIALGPMYGHGGPVTAISCSPNRRDFASCGYGGVCVWGMHEGDLVLPKPVVESAESVAERYELKAYGSIRAVEWFSDGRRFASAGEDCAVRIWDTETRLEVSNPLVGHNAGVNDMTLSKNEELLATAGEDGTICVWDIQREDLALKPLSGHSGPVFAVRFTPDEAHLASGGEDKTVRIWDVQSGAPLHVLQAHNLRVRALSISAAGSRLASGSDDGTIRIWDIGSYDAFGGPLQHEGRVLSVSFAPDGSQVLSGSSDKTVRVWNISRGEQVFAFKHKSEVGCVQFSARGDKFLSASNDWRICVWEAATGVLLQSLQHNHWVLAAAFSPDGGQIVGGTTDSNLYLWDVSSGQLLHPKRLVRVNRKRDAEADPSQLMPTADSEPPQRGDLSPWTRAFRRFRGSTAGVDQPAESHELSPFEDEDDAKINDNSVTAAPAFPSSSAASLVPQSRTMPPQANLNDEQGTGSDKGLDKGPAQRPVPSGSHVPASESRDSLESFMNRPAIVTNKNGRQGQGNFFDDLDDLDDSTQHLRPSGETPEEVPHNTERGNLSTVRRPFNWLWEHIPGSRTNADTNQVESENATHSATPRDQWVNVTGTLRRAMNRLSVRGGDTEGGQGREGEAQSYHMSTFARHNWRPPVIISPAYGSQRVMASGDTPGRLPGGDTVPVDRDVSPSGSSSDSASSEERYPFIVELFCFCNCSLLFTRRKVDSARSGTELSSVS